MKQPTRNSMYQTSETVAGDTSTLFNKDLWIETYVLMDSGSANTLVTQVADAHQVQQTEHITLPQASLHGESLVRTAEVRSVYEFRTAVVLRPEYLCTQQQWRIFRCQ